MILGLGEFSEVRTVVFGEGPAWARPSHILVATRFRKKARSGCPAGPNIAFSHRNRQSRRDSSAAGLFGRASCHCFSPRSNVTRLVRPIPALRMDSDRPDTSF